MFTPATLSADNCKMSPCSNRAMLRNVSSNVVLLWQLVPRQFHTDCLGQRRREEDRADDDPAIPGAQVQDPQPSGAHRRKPNGGPGLLAPWAEVLYHALEQTLSKQHA